MESTIIKKVKDIVLKALEKFWTTLQTKVVQKTDIVNNLNSTSTNVPLSAKQGNVLKGFIDECAKQDIVGATKNAIGMTNISYTLPSSDGNLMETNGAESLKVALEDFSVEMSNAVINLSKKNIGDAFSSEKTYAVGEYAIYGNELYKFTAEKVAGEWDPDVVMAVKVADELNSLNGNLTASGIVLWENPDPTASFAAQNITLSSDSYSTYEVFYTSRDSNGMMSQKSMKNYGVTLIDVLPSGSGSAVFRRVIKTESNTVFSVAACTYSTGSAAQSTVNQYLIPVKIIGYK